MKLNQLFKNAPEIEIDQLSTDSRMPMNNAIFFCLDGIKYDGHKFVNDAIENGAIVIVYCKDIDTSKKAIYIKVNDVNESLYKTADIFYNHPNEGIYKYLISGCYGRSTVSSLINYFLNIESSCGYIGVFGINYKDRHLDITFPALTPLENIKVMDNLKNENIKNVVFESSVISLFYKKSDVIKPDIFIYTNTSKYCSDYRVCNNYYFENIRRYLYSLEDDTCVLFNRDDESFEELYDCVNNYKTYGEDDKSDYMISEINILNNHTSFKLKHLEKEYIVNSNLIGKRNVYNLTAAISALNISGFDIEDIISLFSSFNSIEGVMEKINDKYNIYIDCGNELDNIKNSVEFAKEITKRNIICLLSVNYTDSDLKIKQIIEYLESNADIIILTENETLQGEAMSILSGCNKYIKTKKVIQIAYRSVAIENAINILHDDDSLLILGKGNEKFLDMSFGKERYLGDKFYALKYLENMEDKENETI